MFVWVIARDLLSSVCEKGWGRVRAGMVAFEFVAFSAGSFWRPPLEEKELLEFVQFFCAER